MKYPIEPKIEFVEGSRIDKDALGLTDFGRGIIYVPTFEDVLKYVKDGTKGWFRRLAARLSDYILGHELYVEWYGRPESETEHAGLEAQYLSNSLGSDGLVGLVYHKIGLEAGKEFSKSVSDYFDIENAWQKAKKKYGKAMDEIKAGIEVLLGLKPVEVEYV